MKITIQMDCGELAKSSHEYILPHGFFKRDELLMVLDGIIMEMKKRVESYVEEFEIVYGVRLDDLKMVNEKTAEIGQK